MLAEATERDAATMEKTAEAMGNFVEVVEQGCKAFAHASVVLSLLPYRCSAPARPRGDNEQNMVVPERAGAMQDVVTDEEQRRERNGVPFCGVYAFMTVLTRTSGPAVTSPENTTALPVAGASSHPAHGKDGANTEHSHVWAQKTSLSSAAAHKAPDTADTLRQPHVTDTQEVPEADDPAPSPTVRVQRSMQ